MIMVTIRRSRLVELGACEKGIALFDAIASMRGRRTSFRVEWTPLAEAWFSTSGFAQWARENGVVPRLSLAHTNLEGANLARASLAYASLEGASLEGASLEGASLEGAYLAGAYLAGSNLAGVNLARAYLAYANLGEWERGPDGYARRKS